MTRRPIVSAELLEHLKALFPDKLPTSLDNLEKETLLRMGGQNVIRYLETLVGEPGESRRVPTINFTDMEEGDT